MRSTYRHEKGYPVCPWCGLDNYDYGHVKLDPKSSAHTLCYYWNGPRRALDAGHYANLWTRKGRIYGGTRPHKGFKNDKAHQPAPCRVNEKKWKIVRSGIRLLVACAHPFHEEGKPDVEN